MVGKLLRLPQVEESSGLGKSGIYKAVADGEFPKPVKIGKRSVAWIEDEVEDWKQARIRASRTTIIRD